MVLPGDWRIAKATELLLLAHFHVIHIRPNKNQSESYLIRSTEDGPFASFVVTPETMQRIGQAVHELTPSRSSEYNMAIPGETLSTGAPNPCPDCHTKLVPQVLRSGGGWYIGTQCLCGPYSRESGYYSTREQAERDLPTYTPRDSDFHPGTLKVQKL